MDTPPVVDDLPPISPDQYQTAMDVLDTMKLRMGLFPDGVGCTEDEVDAVMQGLTVVVEGSTGAGSGGGTYDPGSQPG